VFMGGYHGLKQTGAEVTVGGAKDRLERWFGGQLAEGGLPIYTILADAQQDNGVAATRVFDLLSARHPGDNFAVALDESTDVVAEPIVDIRQDRYHLAFWPSRFKLRTAVDAFIIHNRTTLISPVRSGTQ